MDVCNVSANEPELARQDGAVESRMDHTANGNIDYGINNPGPKGKLENVSNFECEGHNSSPMEVMENSRTIVEVTSLTTAEEEARKYTNNLKQAKPQKGLGKSKTENPSSVKKVSTTRVERSEDEKDVNKASTVSLSMNPRLKQPVKTKSFNNNRQGDLPKPSGKSDTQSFGNLTEKGKPKPLKKMTLNTAEEEIQPSVSPKGADAKPQKGCRLPSYTFSFRSNERAEKRKEFYTKLEEKIQAKEVERNNLQAKSKESQEAEIKMLRKSLKFKAVPLPSFYQESPPPKVELKKIPPTRARSPKLGRRKDSSTKDTEEDSRNSQLGRLSLDEKASGVSPAQPKKPQRKSLPCILPSEKTKSPSTMNGGKTKQVKAMDKDKSTVANGAAEARGPSSDAVTETTAPIKEQVLKTTSETSSDLHADNGSVDEGQLQTIIAQEAIVVEQ